MGYIKTYAYTHKILRIKDPNEQDLKIAQLFSKLEYCGERSDLTQPNDHIECFFRVNYFALQFITAIQHMGITKFYARLPRKLTQENPDAKLVREYANNYRPCHRGETVR